MKILPRTAAAALATPAFDRGRGGFRFVGVLDLASQAARAGSRSDTIEP